MSSKLIYPFNQIKTNKKLQTQAIEKFGIELNYFYNIKVIARFQKKDGSYTEPKAMLFDTGASITLLTHDMFDILDVEKYIPYTMSGVIKDKICQIHVKICRVTLRLEDKFGNVSPSFDLWVAIADREDVPLLLGMADILKLFDTKINHKKEELHLIWNY